MTHDTRRTPCLFLLPTHTSFPDNMDKGFYLQHAAHIWHAIPDGHRVYFFSLHTHHSPDNMDKGIYLRHAAHAWHATPDNTSIAQLTDTVLISHAHSARDNMDKGIHQLHTLHEWHTILDNVSDAQLIDIRRKEKRLNATAYRLQTYQDYPGIPFISHTGLSEFTDYKKDTPTIANFAKKGRHQTTTPRESLCLGSQRHARDRRAHSWTCVIRNGRRRKKRDIGARVA